MKIATWNVNSIRKRLPLVVRLLEAHDIDVLCLQETKVEDVLFPTDKIRNVGYPYLHFKGQKSYNGVAIISRLPFLQTGIKDWCDLNEARHIYASVKTSSGPLEIHNFYFPAGGEIPDPAKNLKFSYKLRFISEVTKWFSTQLRAKEQPIVLVGDLNVAPLETDVWSHEKLKNVITHTEIEIRLLKQLQTCVPWIDTVRHFIPKSQHIYSWWSYRTQKWLEMNKGRRLDHIWVTPVLEKYIKGVEILKYVRGWTIPSDHVPVILSIKP